MPFPISVNLFQFFGGNNVGLLQGEDEGSDRDRGICGPRMSAALVAFHHGWLDISRYSEFLPHDCHALAKCNHVVPWHAGGPVLLQFRDHLGIPNALCITCSHIVSRGRVTLTY